MHTRAPSREEVMVVENLLPKRVLICHVDADSTLAKALHRALLETVSYDEVIPLKIGELRDWSQQLYEAINEAGLTIMLASPNFLHDPDVQTMIALSLLDRTEHQKILPVSFGTSLPGRLALLPSIDIDRMRESQAIPFILSAIHTFFKRYEIRTAERREVQARVEATIDEYVNPTIQNLSKHAYLYQWTAYVCYAFSLLALIVGFRYAWLRTSEALPVMKTWQDIVQHLVTSVILIALLGAVARLAFVLGKSFMVESLRNTDRIHAISYGQFYLKAFGNKAEWNEIKEAFQHWNIDKGSSFINQEAKDIDPQIAQMIIEIVKNSPGKVKELIGGKNP